MNLKLLENIIEIKFGNKKEMIIFKNKNMAQKNLIKINNEVKNRDDFMDYLQNLDYKVILKTEELEFINESIVSTPPIYNMALKTGVDQLIIVN
ncbi:MAG TPA: hypothetical protein VJ881_01065 [Halanaerobiales bacterium]|nr:hypothetical protein [Halanaerobiales bacterium]